MKNKTSSSIHILGLWCESSCHVQPFQDFQELKSRYTSGSTQPDHWQVNQRNSPPTEKDKQNPAIACTLFRKRLQICFMIFPPSMTFGKRGAPIPSWIIIIVSFKWQFWGYTQHWTQPIKHILGEIMWNIHSIHRICQMFVQKYSIISGQTSNIYIYLHTYITLHYNYIIHYINITLHYITLHYITYITLHYIHTSIYI